MWEEGLLCGVWCVLRNCVKTTAPACGNRSRATGSAAQRTQWGAGRAACGRRRSASTNGLFVSKNFILQIPSGLKWPPSQVPDLPRNHREGLNRFHHFSSDFPPEGRKGSGGIQNGGDLKTNYKNAPLEKTPPKHELHSIGLHSKEHRLFRLVWSFSLGREGKRTQNTLYAAEPIYDGATKPFSRTHGGEEPIATRWVSWIGNPWVRTN